MRTELRVGDLIQRMGAWGFWHVGVLAGWMFGPRGYRIYVYHNDKETKLVQLATLEEFAAGQLVYVKEQAPDNWSIQQQIIARAHSLLGQRFSLINFNCEHYASYAKRGVSASPTLQLAGACLALVVIVGIIGSGGSA